MAGQRGYSPAGRCILFEIDCGPRSSDHRQPDEGRKGRREPFAATAERDCPDHW